MSAAAVIGALTVLSGCADEEEPLATGGELIRLEPATTVPAATVAPTTEPAVTSPSTGPAAGEPVDPVDGCINWYRVNIEAEDPAVLAVWEDELDEDLVQLVAECERLADEEPDRVQDMIAETDAIESDPRPPTSTSD